MKYTIQQIEILHPRPAVELQTGEQWNKLLKAGLYMTSKWWGMALYFPTDGTYASGTSLKNPGDYANNSTLLDYSDILFEDGEETLIPLIFN